MKRYTIEGVSSIEGIDFLERDENFREIKYRVVKDVTPIHNRLIYPEVHLYSYADDRVYNLIEEKTMSLLKLHGSDQVEYSHLSKQSLNTYNDPVFFFIYNTDNYYHFLYDSLPYLITFRELKQVHRTLKLLVNYPNNQSKSIYNFVREYLELLGINESDTIFIQKDTLYKTVMVSDSYTYGKDPNLPPRKEVYSLYRQISECVSQKKTDSPKKLYISRRSWKHGNYSNIGTNYTNRRKMTNEDQLVEFLETLGYQEVFTELLDTREKISLFRDATHVVGAIGGGMANVVFSSPNCKVISICSPGFLEINSRFTHSMCKTDLQLFEKTKHTENSEFLRYMRVKCGEIVGEVIDVNNDRLTVAYLNSKVAGWNSSLEYKHAILDANACERLDSGLNSSWEVDIEEFKRIECL